MVNTVNRATGVEKKNGLWGALQKVKDNTGKLVMTTLAAAGLNAAQPTTVTAQDLNLDGLSVTGLVGYAPSKNNNMDAIPPAGSGLSPLTLGSDVDTGVQFGARVEKPMWQAGSFEFGPYAQFMFSPETTFVPGAPVSGVTLSRENQVQALAGVFTKYPVNDRLSLTGRLGAGIDWSQTRYEDPSMGVNDVTSESNFMAELAVGTDYKITDRVSWVLEGAIQTANDIESTGANGTIKSKTGNMFGGDANGVIRTGISYKF